MYVTTSCTRCLPSTDTYTTGMCLLHRVHLEYGNTTVPSRREACNTPPPDLDSAQPEQLPARNLQKKKRKRGNG